MEENTPTTPPVSNATSQEKVPNSVAVLVLGILSIVCCYCVGIVGLILGIIALILSNKSNAAYEGDPSKYTIGSYKNMKAGRVCAIIGTIISAIFFVFWLVYFVILGAAISSMPMGF